MDDNNVKLSNNVAFVVDDDVTDDVAVAVVAVFTNLLTLFGVCVFAGIIGANGGGGKVGAYRRLRDGKLKKKIKKLKNKKITENIFKKYLTKIVQT